jgi:hypothetical protein
VRAWSLQARLHGQAICARARSLPDPPVFHGHPKKDNLPVFLHDLKMWFRSVQGISSSMSKERESGLLDRAFSFQSQTHDWYESHSGKRVCSERALNVLGTGKNVLEKTFSPRTSFVPQERS